MPVTVDRYTELIGVRLTERDAERLRQLAAADDRQPSALARRLLVRALAQQAQQQDRSA
jgi:hypothetical protein